MAETLSVDVARALQLSRACLEVALDLRVETDRLLAQLRDAGEDPFVLGAALRTSDWAASGTRRIGAVIQAVESWRGATPGTSLAWVSSPASRVDDDGAAGSAADAAVTALRAGDIELVAGLVGDWLDNPAFAGALGTLLTVGDLAPWLVLAVESGADVSPIDDGSTTVLELVGMLGTALAAATVAGGARFTLAELLEEGSAGGLTPVGAAMLFAAPPGASDRDWSRAWLVDAVRLLVVPLTAEMRTVGPTAVGRRWGDAIVDLRVPVLDALARDPHAARRALASVDLRELVGASAGYLDHGAAIAAALVAATRPDGSDHRGAARVMGRFIDALSTDDPPPTRLAEELGNIAWPWIGSFRVDRADRRDGGVPSLLPDPDESALRRYVALAGTNPVATTDLLDALDIWVGFQLAVSGAMPPDPQVLHDIGAVGRFVSEVERDRQRSQARTGDARREGDRRSLEMAGNGVGVIVAGWWGQAAGYAVANVVAPRVAPDLQSEIEHLARVPLTVARDQEILEWQVLAHLWWHRDTNELFVDLAPPPPAIVGPNGGLRSPETFDDAAWGLFREWRDQVAAGTGLDNVGAAFGRDAPPLAEQGGGS